MSRSLEIALEGLAVFARHGALPEERALGQRFRIDVVLVPASDRACDTDDVHDAVHYGEVADRVLAIAPTSPRCKRTWKNSSG